MSAPDAMELERDEHLPAHVVGGGVESGVGDILRHDPDLERELDEEMKNMPARVPLADVPEIGIDVVQLHFSIQPLIVHRLAEVLKLNADEAAMYLPYGYPKFFVPPQWLRVAMNIKSHDVTVTSAVRAMFLLRSYYQLYAHPCMDPARSPNGLELLTTRDFMNRTYFYGPSVRLDEERPQKHTRTLEDLVADRGIEKPSQEQIEHAQTRHLLPIIPHDQIFTIQEVEDFMAKALEYFETRLLPRWQEDIVRRPYKQWNHLSGRPMPFEDRIKFHFEVEIALLRFYSDLRLADIQPNVDDEILLVWYFRCMEYFIRKMERLDYWHSLAMRGSAIPNYKVRAKVMANPTPPLKDASYETVVYEFYEWSKDPDPDMRSKLNAEAKLDRDTFKRVQAIVHQKLNADASSVDASAPPSTDAAPATPAPATTSVTAPSPSPAPAPAPAKSAPDAAGAAKRSGNVDLRQAHRKRHRHA